jgi:3'-phosphoadenosine 5'-phosphosulfate (PAPS) 3'-phosphatase
MTTGKSKLFGIGLSKTGTTSLANALQILGYKTKDNMGVVKYATGDLSSVDLDVVDAHDALTDTPIPSFYRALDARYPGSKFILTVRDSEGWLTSCKKQFTQRFAERQTDAHKRLFLDLYGTDVFDEHRFASGYARFVDGAREYFMDRPHDLLIINVTAGEGWEQLCPFLGRPVPDLPFPKANVTEVRWMNVDDIVAVATHAGDELLRRYDGERQAAGLGDGVDNNRRSRTVKQLFDRLVETMRGEDAGHAAARAAHKVIIRGLNKLNPKIPVLSRAGDAIPYDERRGWNHLWLVDPLDGEGAFVGRTGEFSVNIALIEDGRPIYGVVHEPATGATYYASAGKGAYRRAKGEGPVPLAPGGQPTAGAGGGPRDDAATEGGARASSYALAMCLLSDGTENYESTFPRSMEWQTAAAQAILNTAGMRVCERESGRELRCNKKDLANSVVRVAMVQSDVAAAT